MWWLSNSHCLIGVCRYIKLPAVQSPHQHMSDLVRPHATDYFDFLQSLGMRGGWRGALEYDFATNLQDTSLKTLFCELHQINVHCSMLVQTAYYDWYARKENTILIMISQFYCKGAISSLLAYNRILTHNWNTCKRK